MRAHLLSRPTKGGVALAIAGLAFAGAILWAAAPGSAAPSSGIVINEVYGGGGNAGATYTNDFIELTNRSNAPISVDGWSVQYHSSGATGAWQVTPLSGTIAPGAFYLVAEAQGTGGTQPATTTPTTSRPPRRRPAPPTRAVAAVAVAASPARCASTTSRTRAGSRPTTPSR